MTQPPRTRPRTITVAAIAIAASLLSCQERLAIIDDDEERGYHFCVTVNVARVFDDEGNNAGMVLDEDKNQTDVCWCLTLEDGQSPEWKEKANDVAYDVCLANAATMGYPDPKNNDCASWYSIGHWGEKTFRVEPWEIDYVCDPDGSSTSAAAGCSVR